MNRTISFIGLMFLCLIVINLNLHLDSIEEKVGYKLVPDTIVKHIEDNICEAHLEFIDEFYCTSYCACEKCCGKYSISRGDVVYGASGEVLTPGRSVAVDPNVIPYGTVLYIDGKLYIAQDTGAFTGNHIDFYCASHEEALANPNKTTDVYAIEIR